MNTIFVKKFAFDTNWEYNKNLILDEKFYAIFTNYSYSFQQQNEKKNQDTIILYLNSEWA